MTGGRPGSPGTAGTSLARAVATARVGHRVPRSSPGQGRDAGTVRLGSPGNASIEVVTASWPPSPKPLRTPAMRGLDAGQFQSPNDADRFLFVRGVKSLGEGSGFAAAAFRECRAGYGAVPPV